VRFRVAAAVTFVLFLFAVLLAAATVFLGDYGENGFGSGPDQADLQAGIVNDRRHLFDGLLVYASYVSTPVDDSLTYRVRLTARGEKAAAVPARPATQTRSFQVGGVEGAALTAGSGDVKVVLLTDAKTRQVIAEPGDSVEWQWSVSPSEPGDYDLVLALTTYQGDSDRALDTLTPPITVHLGVRNTASHRLHSMQSTLIALGGVAGALLGLYAFRAPLTEFARARGEARRERSRNENRDGYL
jgi:hypothetical protein